MVSSLMLFIFFINIYSILVSPMRLHNIYNNSPVKMNSIKNNITLDRNARVCINEIKRTLKLTSEKNKEIVRTNYQLWYDNLVKLEKYINKYNKLPSQNDKNRELKYLEYWISTQKNDYKNTKCLMRDEEIRMVWEDFTKEYKHYL